METKGGTGPGKESAIAAGSASSTGVSLAVVPPSGCGACGLNSITNVIHGGVYGNCSKHVCSSICDGAFAKKGRN